MPCGPLRLFFPLKGLQFSRKKLALSLRGPVGWVIDPLRADAGEDEVYPCGLELDVDLRPQKTRVAPSLQSSFDCLQGSTGKSALCSLEIGAGRCAAPESHPNFPLRLPLFIQWQNRLQTLL